MRTRTGPKSVTEDLTKFCLTCTFINSEHKYPRKAQDLYHFEDAVSPLKSPASSTSNLRPAELRRALSKCVL